MRRTKIFTTISIGTLAFIFCWFHLFISEQAHDVPPFDSIYTSGPINVYLNESKKESVIIRADEHIHDQVTVEVLDGTLKIYNNSNISRERVLDAYVNYVILNSVHASGPSTLTGRGVLNAEKIGINASVSSEVKLRLDTDTLLLDMSGAANVQLAGSVNYFRLLIQHVGDLMAYNLVSQHCKAIINTGDQSPGIARINVQESLDVNIKGPRHLLYRGNPKITNKSIQGKGQLINRK